MAKYPAVMVSFRSASKRRHAYGSAPVAFNTGFVNVEDEFELWQKPTEAKAVKRTR
jgi:hypothetical protein